MSRAGDDCSPNTEPRLFTHVMRLELYKLIDDTLYYNEPILPTCPWRKPWTLRHANTPALPGIDAIPFLDYFFTPTTSSTPLPTHPSETYSAATKGRIGVKGKRT